MSKELDQVFDKYYQDSNNIQISARQEFQTWMQHKVDNRMKFLQKGLMQADDNVKKIREEVQRLVEGNIRELREDLEAVKSELRNVQEAHKKALEDVTMLQQEADRYRSFEQRFYEIQDKSNNDSMNYEKRIEQLRSQMESDSNKYNKGQEDFKQLQFRYSQLESERNKWKEDYEKTNSSLDSFKKQQIEFDKIRGERDSLNKEMAGLRSHWNLEKSNWQQQLSTLQTQYNSIQEELKFARNALQLSQFEREKEREIINNMKKKFEILSNLEEERNRLEQQVERDREERALLEREYKQNITTIEKKWHTEFKEMQNWREERIKHQEELNELRRQKVNQDQLINEKNMLQKELEALQANFKRLQEDMNLVARSRDETEDKNRKLLRDLKHQQKLVNTTTTTLSTSSMEQHQQATSS